jgi:hypothetical protein
MARVVNIHPESPQQRLLVQAAEFIRKPTPATRWAAISATRKRWTRSAPSVKSMSGTTSP